MSFVKIRRFIRDLRNFQYQNLDIISKGDVVALIGDYDPQTLAYLIKLIDLKAIIVPLTNLTDEQHDQFFDVACVDYIICDGKISKRNHNNKNEKIENLRQLNHAGLVAFQVEPLYTERNTHDLSIF